MEVMRIEYLRKNDRWSNEKQKYTSRGEKRGVLFCGINPNDPNAVVVGFSLCNSIDRFDYINGAKEPGFGLDLAKTRANKWAKKERCFVQFSNDEAAYEDGEVLMKLNHDTETILEIPPSVIGRLRVFLERCKRYYKDKTFPMWTDDVMDDTFVECEVVNVYDYFVVEED